MRQFKGKIKLTSENKSNINGFLESKTESNKVVELVRQELNENDSIISINNVEYKFKNCFFLDGFIDSHAHIMHTGKKINGLDLSKCKSVSECIEKCKNYNIRQGDWLIGRGWNEELWEENFTPNKKILDEYFNDTPVCLTRVDGHSYWLNTKAFEVCDIDIKTKSPEGGEFLLDSSGELSGIIKDNASELVFKFIPDISVDTKKKYILDAIDEYLKYGVTEIHDMDVDIDLLEIYKELDLENKLKINIKSYIRAFDDAYKCKNIIPKKYNNFEIVGLKFYIDGAIGSRSAALFEPYDDDLKNKGILLENIEEYYEKIRYGAKNGWQIATHAIGDYANNVVINAYEKLRTEYPNTHLRIEHAQIIQTSDISRLRKNNIVCAVQPLFARSDSNMVLKRIGKRIENAYLWKTLLDNGIIIGGSSDAPIESISIIEAIKLLINSEISWQEKENLSLEEALRIYTSNNNLLAGLSIKNNFELGSKPNITIIDGNYDDIKSWKVRGAIVNGELVYQS